MKICHFLERVKQENQHCRAFILLQDFVKQRLDQVSIFRAQ